MTEKPSTVHESTTTTSGFAPEDKFGCGVAIIFALIGLGTVALAVAKAVLA